jgi:preprotein translocase subunit SecG
MTLVQIIVFAAIILFAVVLFILLRRSKKKKGPLVSGEETLDAAAGDHSGI